MNILSYINSLFFAGILLFFFSCSQPKEQPNNTDVVTANIPTAKTVQTKSQLTTTDSIKPRKRNYITETARPAKEINKIFPYDIDLKTVDGKVIKSSELLNNDGKPVVLCFWLTTCYPCRLELKAINKVYGEWEKETGVKLVAISTDFKKNYGNFVKKVNESNWTFEAYNDVNREFRNIMPGALNGLPQTFLLDGEGNIVYHKRKYQSGDEHALFEKIKAISKK